MFQFSLKTVQIHVVGVNFQQGQCLTCRGHQCLENLFKLLKTDPDRV